MSGPDVRAMCAAAVAWLDVATAHLECDGPARGTGAWYRTVGGLAPAGAVLARIAPDFATARTAAGLVGFAWRQFGEGAVLYERLLRDVSRTDPVETYGHFRRAGYRHADLDVLLPHARGLRQAAVPELAPNRVLAVRNAERLARLPVRPDDDAVRRTWLGGLPEPWTLTHAQAYAAFHTVLHLCDWGLARGALPLDIDTYLTRWLPAWTDVYTEAAQWDLVTALLLTDTCLRAPARPAGPWHALAEAQHPSGMLPGAGRPARTAAFRDLSPTVTLALASALAARTGR
ncbi:DUF6895 family protein [Actinomadura flavalba]|uniref:DUF6895 family protein n=1 Tax=Actinomadura flavalba TaxID=1120938 RepID=UPI0003828129|nr:hypothetical protein [Actinomadura flavalba]